MSDASTSQAPRHAAMHRLTTITTLDDDKVFLLTIQSRESGDCIKLPVLIKAGSDFTRHGPINGAVHESEAGSSNYTVVDKRTLALFDTYGKDSLPPELGTVDSSGWTTINRQRKPVEFRGRVAHLLSSPIRVDLEAHQVTEMRDCGIAEDIEDPTSLIWLNKAEEVELQCEDVRLIRTVREAILGLERRSDLIKGTRSIDFLEPMDFMLEMKNGTRMRSLVNQGFSLAYGTLESIDIHRVSGESVIIHPLKARGQAVPWNEVQGIRRRSRLTLFSPEWPEFHRVHATGLSILCQQLKVQRVVDEENRSHFERAWETWSKEAKRDSTVDLRRTRAELGRLKVESDNDATKFTKADKERYTELDLYFMNFDSEGQELADALNDCTEEGTEDYMRELKALMLQFE